MKTNKQLNKISKVMYVALLLFTFNLNAADRTVAVGQSIQSAIDYVNSTGGGTVILKAGTHFITSTLFMKSNVTLQGESNFSSTIKCTLDINIIEASDSRGGLKNLVIQNLIILGVNTVNSGGIQITSSTTDNENIKLFKVRCYETGWGVHIKGAKDVTIEECDFSRNGTLTKIGYAHNLYLRRCYGVTVKNSIFNNSISANGINISYSEDIKIYDCQMVGNYFRGVRAADTDGFLVHNCIVTNNGNVGILANTEVVVTKNIDWQNNCVSNNLVGFETKNGATGISKNNNSFGNGNNYKMVSSVSQTSNVTDASKPCTIVSNTSTVVHIKKRNASSFAIDGNRDGADGQNVYLWSSNASNVNQQWIEIDRGSGYYSYQKVGTNYCIDGNNGGATGQNVHLWTCSDSNQNQQWKKVDMGSGYFRLEKRNAPGFSLDGGSGGANGQNLQLYNSASTSQNLQWSFTTVSSSAKISNLEEGVFSVYPNPVVDVLTFDFSEEDLASKSIGKIYDNSGLVIKSFEIDASNQSIIVSNLKPGIYFISVEGKGNFFTKKFIKN